MAKTVIKEIISGVVKLVKANNFFISKISFKQGHTKVTQTLPFRVKFTNVGITQYITTGAQPIGIAVIGYNNYIL